MPVQMLGLEELNMVEVSDDTLEATAGRFVGASWSQYGADTQGCTTCF